jgi:hypothetical protein
MAKLELKDKSGRVTGVAYYDELPEGTNHDWDPLGCRCRTCKMSMTEYWVEPRNCVSLREETHDAIGYDS